MHEDTTANAVSAMSQSVGVQKVLGGESIVNIQEHLGTTSFNMFN